MDQRSDGRASAVATAVLPLAVLASLVLASGCHRRPASSGASAPLGRVTVITRSEIVAMGAPTAWDVVRARAPRLFASGSGELRIQESRTVNADERPLVVVDGAQTYDLDWLRQLPTSELDQVSILDAEAAQPVYGLRAAGGAIVVVTKRAR